MILSERFEAATLEQLPELLDELCIACGHDDSWTHDLAHPFFQLQATNAPESLLAAAMMLVPEKYAGDWLIVNGGAYLNYDSLYWSEGNAEFTGRASTSAAALGAAIARSLGK